MSGLITDEALQRAADLLAERCGATRPDAALVLGSGLGEAIASSRTHAEIPYRELFPAIPPAIHGQAGTLKIVQFAGVHLLVFCGRLHCYQGVSSREAAFTVRLAARSGVRSVILTCAAGGIRDGFRAGDLMFVSDHLNLTGDNPLRGHGESGFVDLSRLYCMDRYAPLAETAERQGIRLHTGVLAGLPGPTYETPAEIRMLRTLGADAVSMSMIPEAIQAAACGLDVTALAFISNLAAGLSSAPLSHADVLEAGRRGSSSLAALLPSLLSASNPKTSM